MGASYEELRAHWDARRTERRFERSSEAPPPEWPVSVAHLVETLQQLVTETNDMRFVDALTALRDSGLVDLDNTRWMRRDRSDLRVWNPKGLCNEIAFYQLHDMTERLAIAQFVVDHDVYASSFDAAWWLVYRFYKQHKV